MNRTRLILSRVCLMFSGALGLAGLGYLMRAVLLSDHLVIEDLLSAFVLLVLSGIAIGAASAFEGMIEPPISKGPEAMRAAMLLLKRHFILGEEIPSDEVNAVGLALEAALKESR